MLASSNCLQNPATTTWLTANKGFETPFDCLPDTPSAHFCPGEVESYTNMSCLPWPLQDVLTSAWNVIGQYKAILGQPAFSPNVFPGREMRSCSSAGGDNADLEQAPDSRHEVARNSSTLASGFRTASSEQSLPRLSRPSARTDVGLTPLPREKPPIPIIDLESPTLDSATEIEITAVRKAPNGAYASKSKTTRAPASNQTHITEPRVNGTPSTRDVFVGASTKASHTFQNAVGGQNRASLQHIAKDPRLPSMVDLGIVKLESGSVTTDLDLDELPGTRLLRKSAMMRVPVAGRVTNSTNATRIVGGCDEGNNMNPPQPSLNTYSSLESDRPFGRRPPTTSSSIGRPADGEGPPFIKVEERPWQQEELEMQARIMANIGKNLEKAAEARIWEKMKKDGWVKLETAKGMISEQEKLKQEDARGAGKGKHRVLSMEEATKKMLDASEDLNRAKKAEERKNKKRKAEDGGESEKKGGRPKKKPDTKGGKGGKGDFF